MKNKEKLKKYLIWSLIFIFLFLFLFSIIHFLEYRSYTKVYNEKFSQIVFQIKKHYPEVTDEEIIQIFNDKGSSNSFFQKYGIDLSKEAVLSENEKKYTFFFAFDSVFLLLFSSLLVFLFLDYNHQKDKELEKITKYIEEINKKNYSLHIQEISEDELSILKNEIYKTTVMLKESAENSLKDKKELKKSLEDISHQLKTPLTSILVILDNMIDDPTMDLETREDFIHDIKREISNIHFFIQTILKLSKFDVNTIHFVKKENLVEEILKESIKNVSSLCDLKNVEITLTGEADIVLFCDEKWEVEAFTNILKNCVDHSKDGGKILLSFEKNSIYTSVTITDFGDGISKRDLPHIFERFYKGENASSESVGIGLALAKTIIEEDKGTISVTSSSKETKFVIKYFHL